MRYHQWLIVVPARLAAKRLPNKPLCDLGGKPLVVRVCENLAWFTDQGAELVVATDDQLVVDACAQEGFCAEMTLPSHPSGTDRVWEVASSRLQPYVLNVQSDEPFLAREDLGRLMDHFPRSEAAMGTLIHRSSDHHAWADPGVVKVVTNQHRDALYFSRSPIPFCRQPMTHFWHHVGVYSFQREFLANFTKWPPSSLEKIESLEQLRALENGARICCAEAKKPSIGIDSEEDLRQAQAAWERSDALL